MSNSAKTTRFGWGEKQPKDHTKPTLKNNLKVQKKNTRKIPKINI